MADKTQTPKGLRTVKLTHPIPVNGEDVTELNFAELDLGVLEDIDIVIEGLGDDDGGTKVRIDLGHIPRLVSNMANIPYASAKKIKFVDAAKIMQEVMGFLGGFLPTGDK